MEQCERLRVAGQVLRDRVHPDGHSARGASGPPGANQHEVRTNQKPVLKTFRSDLTRSLIKVKSKIGPT